MATYLGPLGGLHRIRPRVDIDTTSTRLGGTHTALSGRRTVDYLGNRATYSMTFPRMTPDELAFLEALHHRHIPGPLRLVLDGLKHNRLSRSAASLGYGGRDRSGLNVTSGSVRPSPLWPSEAVPAGVGLAWLDAESGHVLRLNRDAPAPLLSGETVTASVWIRSSAADAVRLGLNHWTANGYAGVTAGDPVTLTPDTWHRLTVTATPGAEVWAASPAVQVMTKADLSSELTLAAAQIEPGNTASAWSLGGGAPLVTVDTLPTTSPYAPYTIPKLTLLEL